MRKFFLVALAVALVVTVLPALPTQAATPSDVSGHWAEKAINYLVDKGIVNGFPDGTFKPEDPVTRAQFTKMMSLALGYQAETPTTATFKDVASNYWGFVPVETCAKAGLVVGFPDGTFAPDKTVSKAEAVSIIARSKSMFLKDFNNISPFSDVKDDFWAVPYLNVANNVIMFTPEDAHIVTNGNFSPDEGATRAQTATFIYRMLTMEPLQTKNIVVKGSDTMVNLAAAWAEDYQAFHPEVSITVSGGGSGIGIAALQNKTTDICNNSRVWTDTEISKASANGVNVVQTTVAQDAVSFIVNPANPVKELTMEQMMGIYTGATTNWKDLGGPDATIDVYSRDSNSGTNAFVLSNIVQLKDKTAQYGPNTQFLPTNEAIVTEVARDANAIGYCGLGYVNDTIHVIGLKKTASDPAVLPDVENVLNNTYPMSRPLICSTNGSPNGAIFAYINWILGPVGQQTVSDLGFVIVGK